MVTQSPIPPEKSRMVTREMIYARTRSLAQAAGRAPQNIRQTDYQQARRELTGLSDLSQQEAMLDSTHWYD
jgi:hypothetical protein